MMHRIMVFIWWIFITSRATIAHIWNDIDSKNPTVIEMTMRNILESCYSDYDLSNPILILGDENNIIDESIFDVGPVSIISMNDSIGLGKNSPWDFKPKIIVLVEDSPEKLQSNLLSLRRTKLWNYKAHFFILGNIQNQCKNSREILNTTLKIDIMISIYICLNPHNMTELYTVNPITNYALPPWERMESSSVNLNIYHQLFDPNISCRNLDYEKTKYLNGYEIKGVMSDTMQGYNKQKNHEPEISLQHKFQIGLFQTIASKLNASFSFNLEPLGDASLERIANGTADVLLDFGFIDWNPERQFLFPCLWTEVVAVRKTVPQLSTLEKIDNLWSVHIRILAMITLSLFFIVLVCLNREISSAMLDIIRLLTYVSIRTTRKKLSFRIIFAMMLMLMINSNGVFQGSISAFLTKPQYGEGINTVVELEELNYTIYIPPGTMKRSKDIYPNNPVIEVPSSLCLEYLWNTSKSVCIITKEYYYEKWSELAVTMVKEPVRTSFFNNKCRDDWPLYEPVNDILIHLVESGLLKHWFTQNSHIPMLKRRAYDMGLLSPQYQPVKLKALDFAFELLAIGLSLATVVFILEVVCKELNFK